MQPENALIDWRRAEAPFCVKEYPINASDRVYFLLRFGNHPNELLRYIGNRMELDFHPNYLPQTHRNRKEQLAFYPYFDRVFGQ